MDSRSSRPAGHLHYESSRATKIFRSRSSKPKLYLYNNLHNGDVLFSRPLYRRVIESNQFEVVLAGFVNTAYLLEDLVGSAANVFVSEYADVGPWAMFDLATQCPAGFLPVNTWLGQYDDTSNHQWCNVVEVFNRQMVHHGIDYRVSCDPSDVPMIDFEPRPVAPQVATPSIYVDNSLARSAHSRFEFDLPRMAAAAPDLHFLCAARPDLNGPAIDNIIDCSDFDLRDLSEISNQCLAILGKGSGPHCCTYTEANRYKPRAVCGYRSVESPTFWDYPESPIQHLDDMNQVVAFVRRVLRTDPVLSG